MIKLKFVCAHLFETFLFRGVGTFFQRGAHTVSHPGYLHSPLHMFGPENGVCNYLALEKNLWHFDSSDSSFFAT